MIIQNIPRKQFNIENKKDNQNVRFTGAYDAVTLGLRFLDTNQAWGANAVDLGSMVIPRTTVDMVNRGPVAGAETARREASGTVNHSLVGVYGSMAALAFALTLNKTFGIRADKIFADNEMFDIVGKSFHNNFRNSTKTDKIEKSSDALEKTLRDIYSNVSTNVGGEEKTLTPYQIDNIVDRIKNSLINPDIDGDRISKNTKNFLVNYITEATGSETDFKLKAYDKETTTTLSNFVENSYNILKTMTKEKVVEEFQRAVEFKDNKFISGIKKLNNRRTVLGMAIASGVGMAIQPLNIYLTKKKTGSDGFVGVEGREKDTSAGFKMWKAGAAALFGGSIIADLARKEGGLLKNVQYKGMIPTLNQFKLVYGVTIASRFLAARDKDELREAVVKDVLGFLNWLVLGNFVAKGVAMAMDKDKSLIKNPGESSFFKKKLKTRDEVMIEGLKRLNLSSVSKDGKALKFSEMLKLIPAGEAGKAIRGRLRVLNIAQAAGYAYSGLVLGVGIPKLNIYMTNKSEEKRKAKLAAAKAQEPVISQPQNHFAQLSMKQFSNK